MRTLQAVIIVLLGSWQLVAVASPQRTAKDASASASVTQPHVCFTQVFSGPLPGKSDYCLGVRDWNHGDYRSGLEFFKLAAGWGNKNAQYTLGLIYYGGRHVRADVALGLAWLKLANERRNDDAIDRAARSAFHWATPEQRERAEQLYRTMAATYGDKVAASRAWKRIQGWQRRHGSDSGCIRLSGAQAAAAKRVGLAGVPPRSIERMLRPSGPISIPVGAEGSARARFVRQARMARQRFAMANAGVCVTLHMQQHVTQRAAGQYFDGWMGTVSVAPLQQVPAPASTSGH